MKNKKKIEVFEPPIFYENIKIQVIESFEERTKNTINEKIKFCTDKGLPLDKTKHIITKAIQNLSNLVPLVTEQQ